jgi:hypothetical protein
MYNYVLCGPFLTKLFLQDVNGTKFSQFMYHLMYIVGLGANFQTQVITLPRFPKIIIFIAQNDPKK